MSRRQTAVNRQCAKSSGSRLLLCAVCCVLCVVLSGCESLQKKITRKPKHAPPAPNPITLFQDYSRAMTPIDRYRKHYLIFDYWNDDLLDSLAEHSPNPKRYRRASSEALDELRQMQLLVTEETAAQFTPFIEEREKLDRQFQSPAFNTSQIQILSRDLEAQKRAIHRQFFWRDVQDHLKPQESTILPNKPEAGNPAAEKPADAPAS